MGIEPTTSGLGNHRITPPVQSGAESSVRLLLTKNPACSFSCPCRYAGPLALAVVNSYLCEIDVIDGEYRVADVQLACERRRPARF